MTLTLISCTSDPTPVRLTEPPILALDAADDLTLWRFEDGSVVIRIGAALELGADTILVEPHLLTAVWMGLKALDEGQV